jgi:hypothetical protein
MFWWLAEEERAAEETREPMKQAEEEPVVSFTSQSLQFLGFKQSMSVKVVCLKAPLKRQHLQVLLARRHWVADPGHSDLMELGLWRHRTGLRVVEAYTTQVQLEPAVRGLTEAPSEIRTVRIAVVEEVDLQERERQGQTLRTLERVG